MKEIVVTGNQATLRSGTVKLTDSQAASREHALEKIKGKKDLYNITGAITFKRGEVFWHDGEINKTLLEEVGEVVDVKAKKAETDKAKKKAKEATDALAEAQTRISELEEQVATLNTEADERLQESLKKLEEAEDVLAAAVKRGDDAEAKVVKLEEAVKSVKNDGK